MYAICAHTYVSVCGGQTHIQCLPLFLSILLFETESLPKPEVHQLERLAGHQIPGFLVSSFPVLGLQVCATVPSFDVCAEGLTSGPHAECGKHFVGRAISPCLHSLNTLKVPSVYVSVCVDVCTSVEDGGLLEETVLCVHWADSGDQTQAARLCGKVLLLAESSYWLPLLRQSLAVQPCLTWCLAVWCRLAPHVSPPASAS